MSCVALKPFNSNKTTERWVGTDGVGFSENYGQKITIRYLQPWPPFPADFSPAVYGFV